MARELDTIMAIVPRAAHALGLADGASFVLRSADHCHYAEEDAIEPLWEGQRFPTDRCVSGWAMQHREIMVLEDLYADPRAPAEARYPSFVKSLVMVPIRQLAPVGAIGVYWARPHRPSGPELRLLQGLADSASIAMANVERIASLESRLAERTAARDAAHRELVTLSHAVSHDLRAPLRAINGFSQILRDDHAAVLGDGNQHLDRICAATNRMGCLIDDLLALSRVARTELTCGAFDLAPHARDIVQELVRTDPARQVEISIPDTLPAHGDARLVRVVLGNLLRNAWKFTSRRDVARIEVGCQGDAFFVRDNGAGFDAGAARDLFRPFHRMHAADDFAGTGIGLATAQRIVTRHGGRIWADSTLDQGATFSFTLA